jgi:hypothetical protein
MDNLKEQTNGLKDTFSVIAKNIGGTGTSGYL